MYLVNARYAGKDHQTTYASSVFSLDVLVQAYLQNSNF